MGENFTSNTRLDGTGSQAAHGRWWQREPGVVVADVSLDDLLLLYQQDRPEDTESDHPTTNLSLKGEKLVFCNSIAAATQPEADPQHNQAQANNPEDEGDKVLQQLLRESASISLQACWRLAAAEQPNEALLVPLPSGPLKKR